MIRRSASRSLRAMTIVEVLVAVGGMVIVGGIVLGIYEETIHAASKMTTRQAASDYAVLTVDQIVGALVDAVAPSDLDDPSAVPASFGPGELTIPVNKPGPNGGIYALTFRRVKRPREAIPFEIEQKLVKSRGESGALLKSILPLGGKVRDFAPELSFRYALRSRPGEPVKYLEKLEPGQWPVLIEITLQAKMKDYPKEPVSITTSVIPGRIPAKGGVQP